ncbi:hypothetical protein HMPREF0682_0870 [Propionibacterium acidifaciens F0233]|uniref:Uncharacterized protein n=1 Tax=Propionibacterium acidifaciens F0233 TaxID=553198 RepID=U2REV5_9ACTN|nr:hypothetical protein HMPREF0682_0870 [Propionibacterium acidifaciens F0233]
MQWGSENLLAGATTLDARLLEKLAVLLLRHALATLLDDRTHCGPSVVFGSRPDVFPTGGGDLTTEPPTATA